MRYLHSILLFAFLILASLHQAIANKISSTSKHQQSMQNIGFDYYGESFLLDREIVGNNNKFQLYAKKWVVTPQIAVGNDYAREPNFGQFQTYSYDFIAPGIRIPFPFGKAIIETRLYETVKESTETNEDGQDNRVHLNAGHEITLGKIASLIPSSLEGYLEYLYTSKDEYNSILSGFLRPTFNLIKVSKLQLSFLTEVYLARDRLGHFYFNQYAFRPSLELKGNFYPFSFRLFFGIERRIIYRELKFEPQPKIDIWNPRVLLALAYQH